MVDKLNGPPSPATSRALIVGGGRAASFPEHPAGTVTLNPDPAAKPDVVGGLPDTGFENDSFDHIVAERVPRSIVSQEAVGELARLLRPSGTLNLQTGPNFNPNVGDLVANLATSGFKDIRFEPDLGNKLSARMRDEGSFAPGERREGLALAQRELQGVVRETFGYTREQSEKLRRSALSNDTPRLTRKSAKERLESYMTVEQQASIAAECSELSDRISMGWEANDPSASDVKAFAQDVIKRSRPYEVWLRLVSLEEHSLPNAKKALANGDGARLGIAFGTADETFTKFWPAPGGMRSRAERLKAEFAELRAKAIEEGFTPPA